MSKSIHSLSCGFVVLAVVLLSISPSDNLFGLEGKTVSAKSNIQFRPNATGRLGSLRYLNNLGFPGANMFSMAAVGEATTRSAASLLGGPLAIGSYAAGFGSGLANATENASEVFPPTILAGATVTVQDWLGGIHEAKIYYASSTQINHELPIDASPGPALIIYRNTVTGDQSISEVDLSVVAPGLFSMRGTGSGVANALILRKLNGVDTYQQPYQVVNGEPVPVPIAFGPENEVLILALFGTGFRFRSSLSAMTVTIGGITLEPIYAGHDGGGRISVDQANIVLPRSLAGRGLVDIVMTADGFTSNTVQLSFR
jgi:uncharacterized protein (TIGR03437 family)